MKLLVPIGVLLVVIGGGGGMAACFSSSIFDQDETKTVASEMRGPTDAPANEAQDHSQRVYLAPLAGLTFAIGIVCLAVGAGNWRRPVPSDNRPANPWNDQPAEHGDPPRGLV
jgi:hypothetical protein